VLEQLQTRYAHAQSGLHTAARLQLATLQLAVGAYAEAQHSLTAVPGSEALALRARAHLLAGELEPARALAEQMLRALPEDVRSLDLMAQVWVRGGQPDRALPFLQRAVEIDPWDAEATSLLSNLEVSHDR
jgi:tetratricopeptide (TPR) repeat protein